MMAQATLIVWAEINNRQHFPLKFCIQMVELIVDTPIYYDYAQMHEITYNGDASYEPRA